jgi:hypothetical protein
MKPLLFNLLTLLSLLFFSLILALWLRSYLLTDTVEHYASRFWRLSNIRGTISYRDFIWTIPRPIPVSIPHFYSEVDLAADSPDDFIPPGFQVHPHRGDYSYEFANFRLAASYGSIARDRILQVPHYLLLLPTLPLPILWKLKSHKRLRQKSNPTLCLTCNYDLRFSPARCPECSTPTPTSPTFPATTTCPRLPGI